jgi:tetratricopeptide (TPR) repeat protein
MPTGCAPFELGVVEDGQPQRNWHVISEHCRLLYSEPGGRLLGFDSRSVSELDLDALEAEGLFEGPRFDVPVLGLRDATIGEICLAARGYLGDEPTLDVAYFRAAVSAGSRGDLDEAEQAWRLCLEAGAMEAHYGLGYTLLELERPHEGYRHLRFYTDLTPTNAWAWCYRGRAAEGIGENAEARHCYQRTLELDPAGEEETDAAERLDALREA